ncbi:MAG: ATP-binding cassette domain-containing protein [Planctomycetes bacterium]|nr:ATP-binding cassette domain-containing protein [Planctomycetota bacterium]
MPWDDLIRFMEGCGYQTVTIGTSGSTYQWNMIRPGTTTRVALPWTFPDLTPLIDEALAACDAGLAGTVRNSFLAAVEKYVTDYNASLPGSGTTRLAWDAVPDASGYRVYRSRVDGGPATFRLIGTASATTFTDANLANQSTGLPDTDDVFSGVDDYPGVCAFFEQRLVLGRTNNKPTTFWGSDTGIYNSFTRHSPILETDSYEFTLASGEMNEIHWIVPLNDMLLGTSGGEWKAGGGGSAITPLNINARVQSWYGCSPAAPVVTGRTVVFAGRGKRTLRSFSYSLEADGYSGRDLTAYAAHLFAGRVSGPILKLTQLWQDFQQAGISLKRLGDILNTPKESGVAADQGSLPDVKGEVKFEHVNFRYRPDAPTVLTDLNITVKPGQIIGLVGRSGSGKSTLTKLVQRLYVPEAGRVLVDGVDLALVDTAWLRRNIGVVLQENFLFSGTVRENIALSDPGMPLDRVVKAAQLAGAHDFILELPQGYDTEVGERGGNLSGGQRQRLAIARVLTGNPRILIFDEATSALDYESERVIQQNMASICRGRTVFIIAHRLSAVRNAHVIYVLDKGRVVEAGNPMALMAKKGLYYHLVKSQENFASEPDAQHQAS